MSLQLKFSICQTSSCSKLIFKETTGIYNVSTNPTGWGAPNATIGTATSAILTITLGNSLSYNIDLFATTNFPTSDKTFEYEITNEDIGYITGVAIPDQIIDFKYTVIANSITYTQNYKQAFYCNVNCCVNSMFKNLDVNCDTCDKQIKQTSIDAFLMLKGLIYSANSGNISNFNNDLATLQKICKNSNCSNCK